MAMDGLHSPLLDGNSNFQMRGQPKNGFSHIKNMQVPLDFLTLLRPTSGHRASQLSRITILLKIGISVLLILYSKLDMEKLILM